jgi:hypothetical protein
MNGKKYSCNDNFFSIIDTEEKAYWMGFLAADGCVIFSNRQKRVILKLADTDKDHLEKFRESVQSNAIFYSEQPHDIGIYNAQIANKIVISSIPMAGDLVRHGITPRKTFTLKFPWEAMALSLYRHFIRGYFDGDGSAGLYGKSLIVSILGTLDIVTSISNILNSGVDDLGGTIRPRSSIYEYRTTCNRAMLFSQFIYRDATIYLERKRQPFIEYDNRVRQEKISRYVGVTYDKSRSQWQARIKSSTGWKFAGRYETENEAYLATQSDTVQL